MKDMNYTTGQKSGGKVEGLFFHLFYFRQYRDYFVSIFCCFFKRIYQPVAGRAASKPE